MSDAIAQSEIRAAAAIMDYAQRMAESMGVRMLVTVIGERVNSAQMAGDPNRPEEIRVSIERLAQNTVSAMRLAETSIEAMSAHRPEGAERFGLYYGERLREALANQSNLTVWATSGSPKPK